MDQAVDGRLADETEGEAGDGDAELAGGHAAIEVGDRVHQRPRARLPLVHQLLDARSPDRDERELRGDEESVDRHEEWDRDQTDDQEGGIRGRCGGIGK